MSLTLNQFLLLFMWFPLAALLLFLSLIGRFYERFSGHRTFYRYFILPAVLFGAAAVRYAGIDHLRGDVLADVMLGASGVALVALCFRLYRLMIVQQRQQKEDGAGV